MMKHWMMGASALAVLAGGSLHGGAAEAAECPMDRPIVFAGLDWDSNAVHTEIARTIFEEGYGCTTDVIPGSTIPLLTGMGQGDIDVMMEVWKANIIDAWSELENDGKVIDVGVNFPDAVQGWYVPRYLVEGPDAEAPDLQTAEDLAAYKDLFADPEEPGKGRFVNCILGWACEEINTKKLEVYGLADDFTNFRPGTGAALDANIASNYQRQRPFVTYYWEPTWVMGSYDMVKLEEPEYEEATWQALESEDDPDAATAYPETEVRIGVTTGFAEAAPELVEVLEKYETTSAMTSEVLAYMQENEASAEEAALHFLETKEDVWSEWVPEDVAQAIRDSLG